MAQRTVHRAQRAASFHPHPPAGGWGARKGGTFFWQVAIAAVKLGAKLGHVLFCEAGVPKPVKARPGHRPLRSLGGLYETPTPRARAE